MLERALGEGRLPALSFLREVGSYVRGTTTFPSVTPVCLTSIATGAHPDTHHIPHLVWYHRRERRVVEYGSSFSAGGAGGGPGPLLGSPLSGDPQAPPPPGPPAFLGPPHPGGRTPAVQLPRFPG